MSARLTDALDARLDEGETGTIEVHGDGSSATVDVVAAGPLGARIRHIAVTGSREGVERTAADLPSDLRALHDPIEPIEVDPRLGGAVLRTRPDAMEDDEFYEVEVRGDTVSIDRFRRESGGREAVDYDLTRKQLRRIIDALEPSTKS